MKKNILWLYCTFLYKLFYYTKTTLQYMHKANRQQSETTAIRYIIRHYFSKTNSYVKHPTTKLNTKFYI